MTHSSKIIRNSAFSILNKIVTILLAFVSRKLFIMFLTEELLGLNSLFADLLGLLNLADMGLGVAVQFDLYKPIAEKNYEKIGKILNATKRIYNIVGIGMIVVGIILSFFIQFLIKENPYSQGFLQIVFIINVVSSAASYFFVHKRIYLQACEELHLMYIIDTVINILGSILRIVAIVVFKNYYVFVLLSAAQVIVSNFVVSYFCDKKHKSLKNVKGFTKEETGPLFANIKQLIPNKISAYVFSNTDNTIISAFLGLTSVTLFTNYNSIVLQLFTLATMLACIVRAAFGNVLQETDDKQRHMFLLKSYQIFQFIYSSFCAVELLLLLDDFVLLWYGEKFIAPFAFVVILVFDFFLHSMYQPLSIMLEVLGEFRSLKKQEIFAMIVNITVSIGLIFPFGIIGPIMGTFVVDILTTIFRIYSVIYKYYREYLWEYVKKYASYTVIFIIESVGVYGLFKWINLTPSIPVFLIKGVVCAIIVAVISLLFFWKKEEFKYIKERLIHLGR